MQSRDDTNPGTNQQQTSTGRQDTARTSNSSPAALPCSLLDRTKLPAGGIPAQAAKQKQNMQGNAASKLHWECPPHGQQLKNASALSSPKDWPSFYTRKHSKQAATEVQLHKHGITQAGNVCILVTLATAVLTAHDNRSQARPTTTHRTAITCAHNTGKASTHTHHAKTCNTHVSRSWRQLLPKLPIQQFTVRRQPAHLDRCAPPCSVDAAPPSCARGNSRAAALLSQRNPP
jgi:hypothetical protein